MQFKPRFALSQKTAARMAAILLFVLAAVVAALAVGSLVLRIRPDVSFSGITITIAADAVQSATCAYLALIALVGLGCNAAFHIPLMDSVAALVAIPFLIREGWLAWKRHTCGCC